MPGVVMENGAINRAHTNHDRDPKFNGVNGGSMSLSPDKKPPVRTSDIANGLSQHGINGSFDDASERQVAGVEAVPEDVAERMRQQPPEIQHITQGFFPLSALLTRQAQKTHNALNDKILELARMPMPAAVTNGSLNPANAVDDSSIENLNKKVALLSFAQEQHEAWIKILVLTQWSRRSDDVSKVIDLRVHLMGQKTLYDEALYYLSETKRGMAQARVPNPDLKTAIEVLSTGKPRWMPQLGYIEPPPLTSLELLRVLENINTLLSIRLNLHDYDKTPIQFRDYTIKSGRVTFKVPGEFELDLTIADEDPEKQFWFIDFRFLFNPAPGEVPETLLFNLERKVNAVLGTEGLIGCYKFLHEFVLTHKINEIKKQAMEMGNNLWIDTIKVEPLRRSLCIQYWADKFNSAKSWIILGVHSGKRKDGRSDPKATSRLGVRWFRDAKEVKDVEIPVDETDLSAEALVKSVIARHINHILSSTHEQLQSKPLYANGTLSLVLNTSLTEPTDCSVEAQMTTRETITISMEPITGKFTVAPASMITMSAEKQLLACKDPAIEARTPLEFMRCMFVAEEIKTRAVSVGWSVIRNPGLRMEELKAIVPQDTLSITWLKRAAWTGQWHVAVTIGMSGERWWLIEVIEDPTRIQSHLEIPISSATPKVTYQFLSTLHLFAGALVSHFSNLRLLYGLRVPYMLQQSGNSSFSIPIKLPAVYIKLSKLVAFRPGKPWARDVLKLTFQGLEVIPSQPKAEVGEDAAKVPKPADCAVVISEARMLIPSPAKFQLLSERVDRDVAFHRRTGAFAFRLRTRVGDSVVPVLAQRVQSVERLVHFVEVMQKFRHTLNCESISLQKIVLTYGGPKPQIPTPPQSPPYRARIEFGGTERSTTVVLEQGNPHNRILDYLTQILNSNGGLDSVASLLNPTLPALRALDAIEEAWSPVSDKGVVIIHPRSATWYCLQYRIAYTARDSIHSIGHQKIQIDLRLRQRNHASWWQVKRVDSEDRDYHKIADKLTAVWDDPKAQWRGMRTCAAAKPSSVEGLLRRVNDVVRGCVPGVSPGKSGAGVVVLD